MQDTGSIEKKDAKVLLLYLLKIFNEVCEEAGITYYASAGTCLGAVRHKGLIPWDDDIDCMMPRRYYASFMETCKRRLPDGVVLHSRENDPYCTLEYAKLCFEDDVLGFSDISLDVFFLDETDPKKKLMRTVQNRLHLWIYSVKTYKVSRIVGKKKYIPRNPIKHLFLAICSPISISTLDKLLDGVMSAEKAECDYYINWGSCHPYKKATYRKLALGTPRKMQFENQYVMVAEHPEEILTQLFGPNYMTPPPLEKRVDHKNRQLTSSKIDINKIKEEVGVNG